MELEELNGFNDLERGNKEIPIYVRWSKGGQRMKDEFS